MDKTKLFPIGEVSKLFHISVSSLRHYENIGLLTPEYVSPDSGYRYYSVGQFEVLNTIRTRYSCRSFDGAPIPPELLETGLRYHSYMRYRILLTRLLPMMQLDIMDFVK